MKRAVMIPTVLGALALATVASAQEAPRGVSLVNRPVAAPDRALEIGVSTGFNQGIGDLQQGQPISGYAGAGALGEVDIGYRANPHLMVGAYGSATQFNANDRLTQVFTPGTDVRTATAGVQANWHFRPYRAVDPWVGLGAGYRGFWVIPERGGITTRQGLDLARFRAGVDYRLSPEVALGPIVGVDASMLLSEKLPGAAGYTGIPNRTVTGFVFAGIGGRFDMLGYAEPANVASR
jgi:outer membrane protein W